MLRQRMTVLVAALVGAGASLGAVGSATAASDTLYVNHAATANCSDSGPGSQSQPYCTIAAAAAVAQAGQTVLITGTYNENVVLSHSGTPGAPITFQGNTVGTVGGAGSGFDIAGQHDIVITHMVFSTGNGVSISNSSAINFVTNRVVSNSATGIDLDAATHDVQVRSNLVNNNGLTTGDGGIRVAGTGNVVVDNTVQGNGSATASDSTAGIDILSSAVNTVVADNILSYNRRDGILVAGTGTDVVNNTVFASCRDGIDAADGATNTVVENNISYANGGTGGGTCTPTPPRTADIGVYGTATSSTRVDYNVTHPGGTNPPYVWGTAQATLAAFQAASGQGAHDSEADPGLVSNVPSYLSPAVDSADSGAPGVQTTDSKGNAPVDDPYTPNTGVGSVAYLDRGALELVSSAPPSGALGVTTTAQTQPPNPSWNVTATADTGVTWAPIVSYTFDFGDGSPKVTQSTNTKSHVYTQPGLYTVTYTKTDAAGGVATNTNQVNLVAPTATLTVTPDPMVALTVTADASQSGPFGGLTFKYTFGDGTTLDTAPSSVSHTYAHAGTYPVTVTVTDANGMAASASQSVLVNLVNGYTPLGPVRVLDTRAGIGVQTAFQPHGTTFLSLAGVDGVPASGVTAVALNVTVTEPTAAGVLTLFPESPQSAPWASNLNWVAGQTVANMVIVQTTGAVQIYNNSPGTVQVVADLAGYFGVGATASNYTPVSPARVLDTRAAIGVSTTTAVKPGATVPLQVAGAGGVPASGVTAVALNVTETAPTAAGVLTVYPDGQPRPTASNLNYVAGQTVPNLVIVPVVNGKVDFFNNSPGTVHLVADVEGYFTQDPTADTYMPASPSRVLDTRAAIGLPTTSPLAPGQTVTLQIAGLPPSGVTAVVLNVTVTEPTAAGVLTVYPADPRPTASNLNWVAGQTVPNLVIVPVVNGTMKFFNNSPGTVHVVADLAGYFTQ